jgi:hypothetical protein
MEVMAQSTCSCLRATRYVSRSGCRVATAAVTAGTVSKEGVGEMHDQGPRRVGSRMWCRSLL